MQEEELSRPLVTTLFKNQGVYNGLIGVFILIAIFVISSITWLVLLLVYIILVALYGSLTNVLQMYDNTSFVSKKSPY